MPTLHLILFLSTILTTAAKTSTFVNLVDEMLKDDGVWYLAAAGTTGVRPPWESCVRVTIKYTKKMADCAIMYHNHTFAPVRIISYLGLNEANITEIRSKGPTHQFMIKTTETSHGHLATPSAFKDEISYDAAVNSAICWYGKAETPLEWRYVIMPVNKNIPVDAFFLIGVRARLQAPEYQIGIFTKGILDQDYVHKLTEETNRKNRIYFLPICMRDRSPRYGYWFPPYCLPKMYIKCAVGYRLWDVTHKYNQMGEDDDEVKSINTGKREKLVEDEINSIKSHAATGTIWVKHQ